MTIRSRPYGEIEISERQVISFPVGIFGFEHLHEYALLDAEQPHFYWLQSLEDEALAFVMVNPYVLRPDYVLEVPDEDLESIGYEKEEDILAFAIVTVPIDPTLASANLQGPVVVNRAQRLARQCISLNPRWRTKHLFAEELARAENN